MNSGKKGRLLAEMALTFIKIGLFTFGGGYAMIPVIEDICVEKKKWISHEEMMNVIVIAESTPGPNAINCATYVGYRQAGFVGSLVTTVSVILPSFAIIFAISSFLDNFLSIRWVAHAFRGIRAAVGLLILNAAVKMIRKMKKDRLSLAILLAAFVVMFLINLFSWNFSSVSLMLIAAALSLALYAGQRMAERKGDADK